MAVDDATVPLARERRSNGERSAEMRSTLIEAAIQALCDLGYSRTTTQEICRRAGATSGAIQHHFGSKDELVLATLEKLRSEIEERLESASLSQGTMEERCYKVVRELWETFYSRQRYIAVSEIAIGSRGDRAFYERIMVQRHTTLKTCEVLWAKTFQLSRPDRTRLDAMHVTLSFLRGLNLYTNDEQDRKTIEAQIKIMSGALARIMQDPEKNKANKPARKKS
ncbi:MAG TPA: TetR/AcrR family transcriptional regulator [Bradyrhizobium sp.]|nr:TetR/AcrR family transcriptional regulator [Bradyrhizobium sp.]